MSRSIDNTWPLARQDTLISSSLYGSADKVPKVQTVFLFGAFGVDDPCPASRAGFTGILIAQDVITIAVGEHDVFGVKADDQKIP
jgi:hypothetical protein